MIVSICKSIKQNQQIMWIFVWMYVSIRFMICFFGSILKPLRNGDVCNLIDLWSCIHPLWTGSGKLVVSKSFSALTVIYNMKLQTQQDKRPKTFQILVDHYSLYKLSFFKYQYCFLAFLAIPPLVWVTFFVQLTYYCSSTKHLADTFWTIIWWTEINSLHYWHLPWADERIC